MFTGAMTALVTPFANGRVDERALGELVEGQIADGIDALVPCGTTGETATLSDSEYVQVIRLVVEASRRRVPVIAGAGSNSTTHAISLSQKAKEAGANGLLHVTPYYNRPTQEGLYQHFKAIVEAVDLPTVLYNIPGRSGCDLAVDTVARLSDLPAIVGLKEASGSIPRAQQLIARLGDRLALLSGEDAINVPLYYLGARGCISVLSNVAPKLVAAAWDAASAHDYLRARTLHFQSLGLIEALFIESSPIPVKAALAMMGRIKPEIRLPLTALSGPNRERLRAVLAEHGLV